MKFFLSTLVLGAAASTPALGLFDGTQEPASAPLAPVAEPPSVADAPPAPGVVLARIATAPSPAGAAQDEPVRVRLKRAQTIVSGAQQQDADLEREAAKLEAEVARLREQLESMRGELADRGSARARAPRVQVGREVRGGDERREVVRGRVVAPRAQAEEARERAEEARDRAMALAERARAAAGRAGASLEKSLAYGKRQVRLGDNALLLKEAPKGLEWVVETEDDDPKITWATQVGPATPGKPSKGMFTFVTRDGDDDDDDHEHEHADHDEERHEFPGGIFVVRRGHSDDAHDDDDDEHEHEHEVEHEVHSIVGRAAGGDQTFNIHVEDGEVHVYAGGGPAGGAGPFGPSARVIRGKASAPEGVRFDWATGQLPPPSSKRERVRVLFSGDEEDDDDDEHEGEGDDDDDDHDRFVNVLRKGAFGISGSGGLAELHDLGSHVVHLDSRVELGELGHDIELELSDMTGIDALLEDVTNGPEGLGDNIKVEVHVIGKDGEQIGIDDVRSLKGLPQGLHHGLKKNVIFKVLEDGEEEEIEDEDGRVVIRTKAPGNGQGFFGLMTENTPVGPGSHPARLDARDVALDVELLDLAREIQQELRAMRAELDELRREVMGSGPKPALRGK